MKFDKIYNLILEQLNQTQKLLVKDYALDRDQNLTFGPLLQKLENNNSQQIISITNYQMSQIIASHQIQNNNSNMNNDFINLKKLLYDDQMKWYIFKSNNNIVACAACKENNIWNSLYINELFSFQKGFGALLLLHLLNLNYNIIYLNSDWSQPESLNQYYRQSKFNLTEYVYKRDFYDVHYFYKNKTLNKRLLTKFIEEEFY